MVSQSKENRDALIDDLKQINRAVSRGLWNMGAFNEYPSVLGGRLIFPKSSTNKKRLSEQEARFVYSRVVETSNSYFYSIETPTDRQYTFSSKGKRSAMSDMSLYRMTDITKVVNVELKAKQPQAKGVQESIAKDLVKLVLEEPVGNWFHVLKNANRATIGALLGKMQGAMAMSKLFKQNVNGGENLEHLISKPILFTVCIVDRRCALEKVFDAGDTDVFDHASQFFNIGEIESRNGQLVICEGSLNEWEVYGDQNGSWKIQKGDEGCS